ncbi:efflux RND transporter periplasmic adaptor subunit [Parapedobacter sp. ISTM3]|uniref:Membrane fusion protein, multidrug efflux system n=1 Tax=Parapedobacter luteus TaxID=623280 RepID=A0A1T5A259_9SPHI|nr:MULTISPECIES: efflux RND transporter periplasmic adaptor subunit [Parapedobacter]MBK1440023.1 efflux RND transporter periplasmic adaptor subunit [Parapedobacter sp. ISTM3]SKB28713.1 membrane fusion protein, multidrug efflux system [Parapedobacter luteus]
MKHSITLISLLVALGCDGDRQSGPESTLQAVPVVEIKTGQQVTFQEYPASITGLSTVEIRPQVSGILERVYVDEGAKVEKGQLLFKIDAKPYIEQVNQAKASLQAAEANVEHTQLEVEKMSRLTENKLLADFQLKTAIAAHKVALANLEQAKADLATAQINLDYTTIKAPISGYIGRLFKKHGSLVAPTDAEALTQLSDVHELHVYFSLAERDFASFRNRFEGLSLEDKLSNVPPVSLVLSDNSIYPHVGKIDMVDGQFDRNTGAITLRATFPNEHGLLRSGNTGKIRLSMLHDNALIVPQSATVELQDKIFVYAVDDSNKVVKRPIAVAGKTGPNYLVSAGLAAGDRIVSKGMDYLQEGQTILPQNASADSVKRTALN